MKIFERFGKNKQTAENFVRGFYLDRANFHYPLGFGGFKSFFYDIDIVLPRSEAERVRVVKAGVEKVSDLIEQVYSSEKGFKKISSGEMSSDKREIDTAYSCAGGSSAWGEVVSLNFTAVMDQDNIRKAYVLLHVYGIKQEDLLFVHDAIVGLPNLRISDGAQSTLEQIARIRSGNGPKIENLLLS